MHRIIVLLFLIISCTHETRIDENRVRIDFDDGSYSVIYEDGGRVHYDRFGNIISVKDSKK